MKSARRAWPLVVGLSLTLMTCQATSSATRQRQVGLKTDGQPSGADFPLDEPIEQCLSRAGSGGETAEFLAFNRDLRRALLTSDPTPLALLIDYPLRINDSTGSTAILDATTLARRADRVFSPAIRKAILDPKASLICRDTGVGYGHGALWVTVTNSGKPARYGVATINLTGPPATTDHLVFLCRTDNQRAVIEMVNKRLRYRSWNSGTSATAAPDAEARAGTEQFEGSGVCERRSWSFHNGDQTYSMSELGCTEGPTPKGATAELTVTTKGSETRSWCY